MAQVKTKTLVVPGDGRMTVDWQSVEGAQVVADYEELAAEFCFAVHHSRVEIGLVVFERGFPLSKFVDFISRPKGDFRGDLLFIGEKDVFLSAVTGGEGRVLYRLSESDLAFYFLVQTSPGSTAAEEGPDEECPEGMNAPCSNKTGENHRGSSSLLSFE